MPLSEHEMTATPREVFLSYEDGRPTLWDHDGIGRFRAVWFEGRRHGEVVINVSTEPEDVAILDEEESE